MKIRNVSVHKKLFFLLLPASIAAILIFIPLLGVKNPQPEPSNNNAPYPTRFISQPQTIQQRQNVSYEEHGVEILLDRIHNPQTLSKEDADAKQTLILKIGNTSGIFNTTDLYQIQYIKSPDIFMVEIRDSDIIKAKNAASVWLQENGLSIRAQCLMPVVYYLDTATTDELRASNISFNPITEGCSI